MIQKKRIESRFQIQSVEDLKLIDLVKLYNEILDAVSQAEREQEIYIGISISHYDKILLS